MAGGSPRLPLRQVLGYGLGHVFNDICASLWFTYLLIFLQKVDKSLFLKQKTASQISLELGSSGFV